MLWLIYTLRWQNYFSLSNMIFSLKYNAKYAKYILMWPTKLFLSMHNVFNNSRFRYVKWMCLRIKSKLQCMRSTQNMFVACSDWLFSINLMTMIENHDSKHVGGKIWFGERFLHIHHWLYTLGPIFLTRTRTSSVVNVIAVLSHMISINDQRMIGLSLL